MTYNKTEEPQDVVLQQETFTSQPTSPTFYTVNVAPQMVAPASLTNDQSYGKQGDTLDASLALRNMPSSGTSSQYSVSFNSFPSTTGVKTFTLGFRPKLIRFHARYGQSFSDGTSDGTTTICHTSNLNSSGVLVGSSSYALCSLEYWSGGWIYGNASSVTFTDTGFTVNFTDVSIGTGATFILTAYA